MHWNTSLFPLATPFLAARFEPVRRSISEPASAFGAMSVTEYPDRWVLTLDLPGVEEQDIQVSWNDGSLLIEGERKQPTFEGGKELLNDRPFRKFRRALKIREAVDPSSIEASLENGVLTLVVQRKPETQPAKIQIRTH